MYLDFSNKDALYLYDVSVILDGCAGSGTTNMQYIPDASVNQVKNADINGFDEGCSLNVWCGDEAGMMWSSEIERSDLEGPYAGEDLCGSPPEDWWVLYFVASCPCDS